MYKLEVFETFFIEVELNVLQAYFSAALKRCLGIDKSCGVHVAEGLRLHFELHEDWPMIRTVILVVAVVLGDECWTVRVVLEHDAVCIGWTLLVLVLVVVASLQTLVRGHELDLSLLIVRK